MKKIITLALALVLALSLAACGGNTDNPSGNGGGKTNPIVNPANEAWVCAEINMSYIFNADGSYKSYAGDPWKYNGEGTYKFNNNSVDIGDRKNAFTYENDSLKSTSSEYVYVRTTPFELNTGEGKPVSNGAKIGDISAANWAQVIKDNFDLDLSTPNDWTVKEATSPDGQVGTKIIFTVSGDTTPVAFGEAVYNAAKAIDKRGMVTGSTDEPVNSFADAKPVDGVITFKYSPLEDPNVGRVIVNFFYTDTQVELGVTGSLSYNNARNPK